MAQTARVGRRATEVVSGSDGSLLVRYHYTDVVFVSSEGRVTLDTGGWWTATTKLRMNQASRQYNLGYSVYQRRGRWFVWYDNHEVLFMTTPIHLRRAPQAAAQPRPVLSSELLSVVAAEMLSSAYLTEDGQEIHLTFLPVMDGECVSGPLEVVVDIYGSVRIDGIHPHVYPSSQAACFGDFDHDLQRAQRKGDFVAILMVLEAWYRSGVNWRSLANEDWCCRDSYTGDVRVYVPDYDDTQTVRGNAPHDCEYAHDEDDADQEDEEPEYPEPPAPNDGWYVYRDEPIPEESCAFCNSRAQLFIGCSGDFLAVCVDHASSYEEAEEQPDREPVVFAYIPWVNTFHQYCGWGWRGSTIGCREQTRWFVADVYHVLRYVCDRHVATPDTEALLFPLADGPTRVLFRKGEPSEQPPLLQPEPAFIMVSSSTEERS